MAYNLRLLNFFRYYLLLSFCWTVSAWTSFAHKWHYVFTVYAKCRKSVKNLLIFTTIGWLQHFYCVFNSAKTSFSIRSYKRCVKGVSYRIFCNILPVSGYYGRSLFGNLFLRTRMYRPYTPKPDLPWKSVKSISRFILWLSWQSDHHSCLISCF